MKEGKEMETPKQATLIGLGTSDAAIVANALQAKGWKVSLAIKVSHAKPAADGLGIIVLYIPDAKSIGNLGLVKEALPNYPVIAILGKGTDRSMFDSCRQAGVNNIIKEPYHPKVLLRRLNKAVRLK